MEAQPFWYLFFKSAWIFVSYLPSINSKPEIQLENTVFMVIKGGDLDINSSLKIPPNQTSDVLTCSDPSKKQIYNCDIAATNGAPIIFNRILELKNLTSTGEYFCQYKTAKTFWFLRVRDHGYKDLTDSDSTEFYIILALIVVLLIFSVVGSVHVFRGYWKVCSRKQKKEKKEVKEEKKASEDSVETITNPSSSFYASLEPRPRSIYDVLDHSAAKTEPDPSKAKPKKKKPPKMVTHTEPPQQEGIFESVYENF